MALLKYAGIAVGGFLVFILLLQYIALPAKGGAGGSFGLRPMSHSCIGIPLSGEIAGIMPQGFFDWQSFIHVRYQVRVEFYDRAHCLGQDVWYGE